MRRLKLNKKKERKIFQKEDKKKLQEIKEAFKKFNITKKIKEENKEKRGRDWNRWII